MNREETPPRAIGRFLEAAGADPEPGRRPRRIPLPAPVPPAPLPDLPLLLAGAAEVDITPPPGMPKSGHSRNAQDGTGVRTRLRARVIHLRAGRSSVALVATDLHAGSALVHSLVAETIRHTTDVPRAGLFLGATHTHAGPGQFHGSDFYNRWASNRPGMDPAFTAYLATRISHAVAEACARREPARVAFGSAEVWGFTRNRSLAAHVRNETVSDKRTGAQRRYAAVNPWLHLLRVDTSAGTSGGRGSPLAALAFFSIHGTGISRHDPAYNADVWAYLTGRMAQQIELRTGTRPVCAAVEGTHGDMTPAVRPGLLVYHEAERVGSGIGEAAAELHDRLEGGLSDRVRLATGYREVDLATGPVFAGVRLPNPAVGAAKIAGAVENSTPVVDRLPLFRPGNPKPATWSHSSQGAKWILGGRRLQERLAPLRAFPRVLPVQVVVVGAMTLLALPFEVTVGAGLRLEADLAASRGQGGRTVISSVANDYWDYLTTAEEYALQCYEGASNLFGPQTLDFVSAVSVDLATRVQRAEVVDLPDGPREFRGLVRRYLPDRLSPAAAPGPVLSPAIFVEAHREEDGYWETNWSGPAPGAMAWDHPLVRVEREDGDGGWSTAHDPTGAVTDSGWHLGVFHLGEDRDLSGIHRYAARWYQPPLGRPGHHRFVLEANGRPFEVPGASFD